MIDRSEVEERVVLMPMRIKLQREDNEWIAVMPGWQLPAAGLLSYGSSKQGAIERLDLSMRRYWGVE